MITTKAEASKALEKATKDWRAAKKRERAARDLLAAVVAESVHGGFLNENKVAKITDLCSESQCSPSSRACY